MLASDDQGPVQKPAHATVQQHAIDKGEAKAGDGGPEKEKGRAAVRGDVRDVDNVLEQCVRALLERVESLEKEVSELRQGDQKRRQEQLRFDNRVVDGLAELHLGQRNTDKDVELLNSDGQTALDMIKDLLDQSEANSGKSVVKKRAKGSSDASAVTQAGTATTNSASSSSRDTITTTRGKTSG